MEFEEPPAAACEVELLAHARQTPSTTFLVGQIETPAMTAAFLETGKKMATFLRRPPG
jgi:hypothetical protein